jgi:hypothetical protein
VGGQRRRQHERDAHRLPRPRVRPRLGGQRLLPRRRDGRRRVGAQGQGLPRRPGRHAAG